MLAFSLKRFLNKIEYYFEPVALDDLSIDYPLPVCSRLQYLIHHTYHTRFIICYLLLSVGSCKLNCQKLPGCNLVRRSLGDLLKKSY